ncbi:AMP-binding protein, partial [Rhodococcus koreensis]|uniref:AMP-binding protein n=1 Tax=Rhodococcus koreensis TaxID=99653 RepID=UPI0036718FDA
AAFAHADLPFERLVELLNPPRSTAHAPLTQVMLAFQNAGPAALELPSLTTERVDAGLEQAKFDLTLMLDESEDAGIAGHLVYATDLFDEPTARAFTGRYRRLLDAVVREPSVTVGEIDVLDGADRALVPGHGPQGEPPELLPDLLTTAAGIDPSAPALSCDDRELSYRELDERSNRLARNLIGLGVGPESRVVLALGRSMDLWVAVWAVAKSGAAFVPLDPGTPPDRMTYLLGDSHASVGITVSEHRTSLPDGVPWIVLDENGFTHTLRRRSAAPVGQSDRTAPLRVDNPAYMIYTSGSTGTPKGVVVTHRGLGNFAAEQRDRYTLTADSRVLQVAKPSFDAMMLELLMVAAAGGLLIVSPPGVFAGEELASLVTDRNVTHAFLTPGVLSTLSPHRLGSLKVLVAGGEAVPAEVVDRWAPGRRLYNGYGPTETVIMAAISTPMSPGNRVTIGGPIRGMDAVILDTRLHPVPIGVEGELYLAGI